MIINELRSKLVEYQKSKDMERLGVLRYFLSKVKNKEIELRPQGEELTDEVVFKIIKKLIKQRNEGIEMYTKAGRTESAQKEQRELDILMEYARLFPFEL